MVARALGCFTLLLLLVWLVSIGALVVILFGGGPHTFVGLWATIAAAGLLISVILTALLLRVVPFSHSANVEIQLSPERVFDAMSDLQRLAGIPGLREVTVTYAIAGTELQRRRTVIGVGRVAAFSMERIATDRPKSWVTRYRMGGQVTTTTRRLSATQTGSLLEVEEVGRRGILLAILERFRPSDQLRAAQLANVKSELERAPP